MKTIKDMTQDELQKLVEEKKQADKLLVQLDAALREANNAQVSLMQEVDKLNKHIAMLIEIKHSNEETIRMLKGNTLAPNEIIRVRDCQFN